MVDRADILPQNGQIIQKNTILSRRISPLLQIIHRDPAGRTALDPEEWLSKFWESASASKLRTPFYLAAHPWLTARAARCVARLPCLEARIGDTPEGRIIARALDTVCLMKVFTLSRLGACILSIPERPSDYSAGASKQTLRRKVRAAEKAGISCRHIDCEIEQRRLVAMLDRAIARKSNPLYREQGSDHSYLIGSGIWTVAFAPDGEPLVIAVTPRDGRWALLRAFVSLGESQERSDARYLLTKVVAERLSSEGVRHLFDTRGPSQLPNGLRHFQRMLGFRIARVRLVREPRAGGTA
jgi:hypothetical protein